MESQLNKEELIKIQEGIRDKFSKVAVSPEGLFKYPTGREGLEKLEYEEEFIEKLPAEVISSYCGVGNPFSLGEIHQGEIVLDVGCGAGVDSIIAGLMVGTEGFVDGVDIVPEIIARAEKNLSLTNLNNVNFHTITGEKLPFSDSTFDVIISNGVINLIPDKETILNEMFRVLKPEGRLMLADQVAVGSIKKDMKERLATWFQ
ncbi:methyltransferase domain-containing protein [Desulforhopalus sp. IMCC35007]|uniref:methyltransferase domain-containing protein n=1 Tax=Desulforhopalus sp. IMCC35007 TaxID=2569543 RepID=UPI0010AE11EF|nr:methyltransferase domain-containing protein [Desulforhopalus sp. IMCC35007]TKB11335.1 methyltransferase domain-containing protein [Desulforhopalus sp. IMCC35007]